MKREMNEAKIEQLKQYDHQLYEKIIKLISERKISNRYQKLNTKQEPDNIIEYLEDWIGKIIHDGFPIQRFLQVLFENSHKQKEKQWLERFLGQKKASLLKQNLKPRKLIPRIYIQKDESEIKDMVRKMYPWVSNEDELNLIMKTNYNWRNLSWRQIESQLKRNRYKCKLLIGSRCWEKQNTRSDIGNCLQSESGSEQKIIKQQIGLLFTNVVMLNNIGLYGDCIYVLVYDAHLNCRDQTSNEVQQRRINVVIGFVLTQYLMPVIVFHGLISNYMDSSQSFQSYLERVVTATIIEWCTTNRSNQPLHFIFYYSSTNAQLYVQTSVKTCLYSHQRVFITSVNVAKQKLHSTDQPYVYLGPFSPSKKGHLLQIYSRLHGCVCDSKNIDNIHTLIEKINDRCRLVTIMIKMGLILQQESVNKRESGIQLLLGNADQKITNKLMDRWELQEMKKLRHIIFCKQVLKIVRDIIKDALKYKINKRITCIRDKKHMKIQLFPISNMNECITLIFSIQNHRWECQCGYIYKSSLPCPHIVRLLQKFRGDISYYVSERWKNPQPQGNITKKYFKIRNKQIPVTANKGLARLVNLYRSCYKQYIM